MGMLSLNSLRSLGKPSVSSLRSRQRTKIERTPSESSSPQETVSLSGGSGVLSSLNRKMGKLGAAVCLFCALAGAANAAGGTPAMVSAHQLQEQTPAIETIDNKAETAMLKEAGTCGKIVNLAEGKEGAGAHLTIHGLGAAPRAVKPLNEKAAREGMDTSTFIYKDMKGCDHRQNAQALASELKDWAQENAGETLTIETHSQGGRIALGAFHYLQKDGEMLKNNINLTMISPPLGGFSLANLVLTAPGPIARAIPGTAPTRDMASWSGASRQIRNVKLPSTVETKIYYGSADRMVNYKKGAHQKVAENLDAEVFYIADGVHTSTVPSVANPQPGEITPDPLPYNPGNKFAGLFLQ